MRLLSRAFALLALLGLAAFLTFVGLIVAVHVADVDAPEGDRGWWIIIAGYLGVAAALLFGTLALLAARRAEQHGPGQPPAPSRGQNVILGVLATLLALVGASILQPFSQWLAILAVVVAGAAFFAIFRGSRRTP